MKIIKRGIVPQDVTFQFECNKCETLYEAKKSELHFVADQRDGNYYSVRCEVCNHTICLQPNLGTYHKSTF